MSTEALRSAMLQAGLGYGGPIMTDGRLHRIRVDGDRGRNSWYVLHDGKPLAGAFGCWKRGLSAPWVETRSLTSTEWDLARKRWIQAEAELERVEADRRARARKTAAWIRAHSTPAESHPYLVAKGVSAHGELRLWRGSLVLPLRDTSGELHSLQFIAVDGAKRFLSGGRISGCFFMVCDRTDGPLVVAEGVATALSIHAATGRATVAAMNAGNLLAVAESLRARWPGRELLLAADDDRWTDGNPGLTKATAAAKAVGGKLVVPRFGVTDTKPTDFNDMHAIEGPDAVRQAIEAAATPQETAQEAVARLAALSPLEYDRCRADEAKRLGVRTSTLDAEVAARRPAANDSTAQGAPVDLADAEPWPEPVDGAELLDAVAARFTHYVALPDGAADALALWVAHAHCFEVFVHTPRLNLCSPEKGCGKTTLLDVLGALVPRPLRTESITAAVLFRLVETHKPTLLLDEVDCYLAEAEELRGLLNSGHKRGAKAFRCEGDANTVRAFSAFAPAALAGIGNLPGTLHDRSLVVRLIRAKPGEVPARFDSRRIGPETELCRKLARWTADHGAELEAADPVLPEAAHNRLADNWRPLFAIADAAGHKWRTRAEAAFARLLATDDADAQGLGVMLLADLRGIFEESRADRLFSRAVVERLNAMADRPWPEAHHGRPVTETWLARRLRRFGVGTRTLRSGEERAKGYELADFKEAFERFLPADTLSKRDNVTSPLNTGVPRDFPSVTAQEPVTLPHIKESPANQALSRLHASIPPEQPVQGEMTL